MSNPAAASQPSQADILAALSSQSSLRRSQPPATLPFSGFANPSADLLTPPSSTPGGQPGPSRLNSRRVYCFRDGCGSLILMDRVGELVEVAGDVLPDETSSPFPSSSASRSGAAPASNTTSTPPQPVPEQARESHLYLRVPTPFSFENVGYSRPDASTSLPAHTPGLAEAKGKVKWLICAECDLGPVGWGFEGAKEAWVDMARVRYAA